MVRGSRDLLGDNWIPVSLARVAPPDVVPDRVRSRGCSAMVSSVDGKLSERSEVALDRVEAAACSSRA